MTDFIDSIPPGMRKHIMERTKDPIGLLGSDYRAEDGVLAYIVGYYDKSSGRAKTAEIGVYKEGVGANIVPYNIWPRDRCKDIVFNDIKILDIDEESVTTLITEEARDQYTNDILKKTYKMKIPFKGKSMSFFEPDSFSCVPTF